jgi:hypothetical protein
VIARGGFTTLIVAGSFALAACGGADSGGGTAATPTPATPTQPVAQTRPATANRSRQSDNFPARFEDRVDGMCGRAERHMKALVKAGIEDMDDVHAFVVVFEGLATDFETTKAPARNKRAWKHYTRLVRDTANAIDRVEIEAADGDLPAFNALQVKLDSFDKRMTKASARHGFEECASD